MISAEIKEDKKEEIKEENEVKEEKVDIEEKENIEDKKEEDDENKYNCVLNGKKVNFNYNEISQKIEEFDNNEDTINIPVIIYLINLRIILIDKGQVKFIENENFIQKHTFEYYIINYLKKLLK